MKLSAYPEFVAGVGMHPSHSPISGLVGDDETKLLEGAKSAKILPVIFTSWLRGVH